MTNIITQTANYILLIFFTMMKAVAKRVQDRLTKSIYGYETVTTIDSFYKLVDEDMQGKEVPMSNFKDSVLLIVNVASN